MNNNLDNKISISEANQNFSKVVKKVELNDGVLSKFKYVFEDEPKMKRPTSKSKIKNSLKEKKEYVQCDISEIYNTKN